MLIKAKPLADAGWKDIVAKHKLKDNGLLKVLERLKKFGDDELVAAGFPPETVGAILRRIQLNRHKVDFPPTAAIPEKWRK